MQRDTSKVLTYFHATDSPTATPTILAFHPINPSGENGVYTIQWNGEVVMPPDPIVLSITVTSNTSHGSPPLVRLELRPDAAGRTMDVYLLREDASEERIGAITPGTRHTVTVIITWSTRGFSVIGPGFSTTGTLSETLPDRAPSIWFSYTDFPGAGEYEIEDIHMDRTE